jgi:hypothetical protein
MSTSLAWVGDGGEEKHKKGQSKKVVVIQVAGACIVVIGEAAVKEVPVV